MALKSAYEDLKYRTLSKIQGAWGQLKYVAELRSREGRYQHWGFECVHGATVAQSTLARVHRSLLETILRTKLSPLRADLRQSSERAGASSVSYVSSLKESLEHLLPADCPAWSRLHLLSVLQTLSALEVRGVAGPRFSSPPRLLVRSLPPLADASAPAPATKTEGGAEEREN